MPRIHFWLCILLIPVQAHAQSYVPGKIYLDSNGFVEFIPGDLPIVISAPHGGYLEPSNIPDRNCAGCVYLRDSYTQELSREIREYFFLRTGCYPHLVTNLLHRKKFDANRDIVAAADGNPVVEASWYAYHEFLDSAKAMVIRDFGRGIFFDMHGHAHSIQRLELGYALTKSELQQPDSVLNTPVLVKESTIQRLEGDNFNKFDHATLLRGDSSFGNLIHRRGFPAVPSASIPFPLNNEPYFNGGYNTRRHGSLDSGSIDGIQIECNQSVRFDSLVRKGFADSLVSAMIEFIDVHYDKMIDPGFCRITALLSKERKIKPSIWPNPFMEELYTDLQVEGLKACFYDLRGRLEKCSSVQNQTINAQDLPPGNYLLLVSELGRPIWSGIVIRE